jgi:hypothetical protein
MHVALKNARGVENERGIKNARDIEKSLGIEMYAALKNAHAAPKILLMSIVSVAKQ